MQRRQAKSLIGLAVALGFLSVFAAASQAGESAPVIGAEAPGFELRTLDGQLVRLEKFKGKPLIMNFFASWCDPCHEEMPLLNALAAEASSNGYSMLGIAIQDRRASVAQFAEYFGVVFPLALDRNSRVQRAYRVLGPPATFFIDARGIIRDIVIGPLTPDRARQAMEKAGAGIDRPRSQERRKEEMISRGERLFRSRCSACHTIGGGDVKGVVEGSKGPDLLGVTRRRERAWLARWLANPVKMLAEKDPIAMKLYAQYNNVPMPNLYLNEVDVASLIEYMDAESRRIKKKQRTAKSPN